MGKWKEEGREKRRKGGQVRGKKENGGEKRIKVGQRECTKNREEGRKRKRKMEGRGSMV